GLCFRHPVASQVYALSLHDALPISSLDHTESITGLGEEPVDTPGRHPHIQHRRLVLPEVVGREADRLEDGVAVGVLGGLAVGLRSEEHTSELQSRENLVCRLLLEKK